MNDDTLKGEWRQLRGRVRKEWGKLTNDDIVAIKGTVRSCWAGCRSATGTPAKRSSASSRTGPSSRAADVAAQQDQNARCDGQEVQEYAQGRIRGT